MAKAKAKKNWNDSQHIIKCIKCEIKIRFFSKNGKYIKWMPIVGPDANVVVNWISIQLESSLF